MRNRKQAVSAAMAGGVDSELACIHPDVAGVPPITTEPCLFG
jgi:hypothetical protein